MKRAALAIIWALLLVFAETEFFSLATAQSYSNIIIKPDGSIEPSSAPIVHIGETFKITDNFYNASLIVERNNIVLDGQGFTLQGRGFKADGSVAIKLTCTNVTVVNFQISGWEVGILGVFDNNTITNSNFADNHHDIAVYANNYRILGNNLGPERIAGNNNTISKNQIVLSDYDTGFWITNSSGTKIESNNITLSKLTAFFISTDNGNFQVFHNNFLNIEEHTGGYLLFLFDYPIPANATPPYWDNGYEGNYWSDYSGRYPTAREIDNSGIGTIQYVSNTTSEVIDRYPLMVPYNLTKTAVLTKPSISPSPEPQQPEPFPTTLFIAISVIMAVVCIGLVVYFKKRKH